MMRMNSPTSQRVATAVVCGFLGLLLILLSIQDTNPTSPVTSTTLGFTLLAKSKTSGEDELQIVLDPSSKCVMTIPKANMCNYIQDYPKTHEGRKVQVTDFITRVCAKDVDGIQSCMMPQTVLFDPPLKILPLNDLKRRLQNAGTADCVSGPMNPQDLEMQSYVGADGAPRWSVFRKQCSNKYRDYTPLEFISVLYHYTHQAHAFGVGQRGIAFHGDSMVRNLVYRLPCYIRNMAHCSELHHDVLYIIRSTGDEIVPILTWRATNNLTFEDNQKEEQPLRIRCVLSKYFPGYLRKEPRADQCSEHNKDVVLAFLSLWESYPHLPSFDLLGRMAPSSVSHNCFTYWWNRTDTTTNIVDLTRDYLEYEERRMASAIGGRVPSNAMPFIMFYSTTPTMERDFTDMINIIDPVRVAQRNKYLRSLPWQEHPHPTATPFSSKTQLGLPIHRYLIDFDSMFLAMNYLPKRRDHCHFLCSLSALEASSDFFCGDSMDLIPIQWIAHIVAAETFHSTATNWTEEL